MKTKKRILVVDDDACMRELLSLHLSNAGYDVAVAEDGVVGGNQVLREPPDMLIVDVQMPYLNGIDLVSAMRAEPQLQRLPIIIISSREQYEEAALLLGAQYLLKPFSKDDLLSTVAAFFRASSQRNGQAGVEHALPFPELSMAARAQ